MKLQQLIDVADGLICINPQTLETYNDHWILLITQSLKLVEKTNESKNDGILFIMPTIDARNGNETLLDHSTVCHLLNVSLSGLIVNECELLHFLESAIYPVFKISKTTTTTTDIIFGQLCNHYYNYPRRSIERMIGVTGTNGKTTVTHMIEKILTDAKLTVGLIGTLGYRHHSHENSMNDYIYTGYTTPTAWTLQTILNDMTSKYHIENIIMETSSHALTLDRVHGCHFNVAVFTNFTQDHLNFHKTMENYLESKLLLFSKYLSKSSQSKAIINHDDPLYEQFVNACPLNTEIYTYGLSRKNNNSFQACDIKTSTTGITYTLSIPSGARKHVHLNTFGEFNIYNSLACIATCLTSYSHILTLDEIIQSLETFQCVKGRLEFVIRHKPFSVVIDFAHTPDALEKILTTGRQLLEAINENGRLIVVFGCGGNADQSKRPILGHIAEEHADIIIITSDNPRQENPQLIINDILSGIQHKIDNNRLHTELNREKAIHLAMDLAENTNDLIMVTGKGHETKQIFADHSIPFCEKQIIQKKYQQMMDNNKSLK